HLPRRIHGAVCIFWTGCSRIGRDPAPVVATWRFDALTDDCSLTRAGRADGRPRSRPGTGGAWQAPLALAPSEGGGRSRPRPRQRAASRGGEPRCPRPRGARGLPGRRPGPVLASLPPVPEPGEIGRAHV